MEGVRTFLESSTIHGLSYIATTKRLIKIFWVLVVIAGFTGAGILIYKSILDWQENPITTTIETLPITDINLPKVTVCPPKNTYTTLNYDMKIIENTTLKDDTREYLMKYTLKLFNDNLYEETLANLRKLNDNDRYWNWYKGRFIYYVIHFWGLCHPLVVMSSCSHLLAYPLML